LQHPGEIAADLLPNRAIQPVIPSYRIDHVLRRHRSGQNRGRVRRHDLEQQEADQQHAQQDGHRDQ
jgi:hypothetical protein